MSELPTDPKKRAAQVEGRFGDAEERAFNLRLEADLLGVEDADATAIDDHKVKDANALAIIDKAAAEARSAYVERFQVDDRRKALWAARKITEARNSFENMKEVLKKEVARLEARFERREAFFKDKLRGWASGQPNEGKKGGVYHIVRLPEAGVRLEFRPRDEDGLEILDEEQLLASLLEHVGSLVAYELGLVKSAPKLVIGAVREYLSKNPEIVPKLDGVVERKKTDDKNLVIVRL